VEKEQVGELVNIVNVFMMKYVPKYREEFELEKVPLFSNTNIARLIELFFNWLTNKKYLAHKVRINESYSFSD
jgi:hypothetical protein